MNSPSSTAPASATISAAVPGTAVIRAGIALLAAFALSYDALRQMAVAIHIRGLLTYAFPLVIDGFIAIGVGALLMLRTAPTRSRLYVWALVGLATLTSIWANALHAIRLNQQIRPSNGLRLGDTTVGALSAVAPLALAGAVHLYIVVRRHASTGAEDAAPIATKVSTRPSDVAAAAADVARCATKVAPNAAEVAATAASAALQPSSASSGISAERLAIARSAPTGRHGRASRRHIEDAFRSRGLTIGRQEADLLKDSIQAELDTAARQATEPAALAASTS